MVDSGINGLIINKKDNLFKCAIFEKALYKR
jgi:hypothetical protein